MIVNVYWMVKTYIIIFTPFRIKLNILIFDWSMHAYVFSRGFVQAHS